jgi:hypothetical protein
MLFIEKVCRCLENHQIPYAVVGGYAVALHGAVRGTVDIDIVLQLTEAAFTSVEAALKSIGLESRLPLKALDVFRFREEYIQNRNLIAWSFYNPLNPFEVVDIIITEDLAKASVVEKIVGTTKIKVLSKSSIIKMKSQSGRPQDLEDVEALKKL